MMRILTGFFPPTEGKVTIEGIDLARDPKKAKRRIGYLPERVSLYPDLQVREILNFVAEIRGVPGKERKSQIEEKMAQCGLLPVAARLAGHLSKGFQQRVGLAQALMGDPDVLILDEPTSSLDPKQIIEIRELIRELGTERTLILSTHILPEVSKLAQRVLILNQGRIVAQGKPAELEEGLKDRQEIIVRVQEFVGAGLPRPFREGAETAPLQAILNDIPGVESVEKLSQEESVAAFLLRTLRHKDLRPEIARRLVEGGYSLLELTTRSLSLEDIFLKLVVSEEMNVGAGYPRPFREGAVTAPLQNNRKENFL
jgi:ABC-2 type transport system ATP-binding protein